MESGHAPHQMKGTTRTTTTHTLDSNHDQHDHQRNATRTKTETICKMGKRKRKQVIVDYFSLIVRTKSSTKSVRFESRGLPACRMENVCFFSRTLTSSNGEVRCVFVGSNSLRQNCVPVLFDELLSDIFFRESGSSRERKVILSRREIFEN